LDLSREPDLSLKEAVKNMEQQVPGITDKAIHCLRETNNDDALAAIRLYTEIFQPVEKSLYFVLNVHLRNQNRSMCKRFNLTSNCSFVD